MKINEFSNDILSLDKHIQELKVKQKDYEITQKNKINQLTNQYSDNVSKIDFLLTNLELKENEILKSKQIKQQKIENLITNITLIQQQIENIKVKNYLSNEKKIAIVSNEIKSLNDKLINLNKKLKLTQTKKKEQYYKKKEKEENNLMLEEEYLYCQKMLVILTSKIESHSEFVKNLLKTKNCLSNSLEKLNEIIPNNSDIEKDINVIQADKLAENIYSYCNNYLVFLVSQTQFNKDVSELNNFEEVLEYLIKVSKYKLPHNLFEYLIIAICRIMSYENLIELRMKVVNELNDSHIPTLKTEENNELEEKYSEKIKKIQNQISNITNTIKEKELLLSETKNKREENEKNIEEMEKDIQSMIEYKSVILNEINLIEKELCVKQKNTLSSIENLKKENDALNRLISKKKEKMIKNEENFHEEIKSITTVKDKLLQHKESFMKNNFNININYINEQPKDNYNETEEIQKFCPQFKYPSSMKENDLILTKKISPLLSGLTVMKRQIIHVKRQIYESYNPVIRNKVITDPNDFGFKKYFLYLNKQLTKIVFQKLSPLEKTIEISPSSISRIEIPIFTKSLIFVKKIITQLIKKFNIASSQQINEYFIENKENIIKLYQEGSGLDNANCSTFDSKILNIDYREALIQNKKYIFYLYLKPDEDTKIEVILDSSSDYKKWVNGLSTIISDYEYTKQIITKFLL